MNDKWQRLCVGSVGTTKQTNDIDATQPAQLPRLLTDGNQVVERLDLADDVVEHRKACTVSGEGEIPSHLSAFHRHNSCSM